MSGCETWRNLREHSFEALDLTTFYLASVVTTVQTVPDLLHCLHHHRHGVRAGDRAARLRGVNSSYHPGTVLYWYCTVTVLYCYCTVHITLVLCFYCTRGSLYTDILK